MLCLVIDNEMRWNGYAQNDNDNGAALKPKWMIKIPLNMHAVIQIIIKNDFVSCMLFGIHIASGDFFSALFGRYDWMALRRDMSTIWKVNCNELDSAKHTHSHFHHPRTTFRPTKLGFQFQCSCRTYKSAVNRWFCEFVRCLSAGDKYKDQNGNSNCY